MRITGVTQAITTVSLPDIVGDCTRAALATVLGVGLYDVPHFAHYHPGYDRDTDSLAENGALWYRAANRWLRDRHDVGLASFGARFLTADAMSGNPTRDRFPLALGRVDSPRGPFKHHVVIDPLTATVVWDPHPDRDSYDVVLLGADVLVPPRPVRVADDPAVDALLDFAGAAVAS